MKKLLMLSLISISAQFASASCESMATDFIQKTYNETVSEVKSLGNSRGEGSTTKEVWVATFEGHTFSVYFNGPGCEWVTNHVRWK